MTTSPTGPQPADRLQRLLVALRSLVGAQREPGVDDPILGRIAYAIGIELCGRGLPDTSVERAVDAIIDSSIETEELAESRRTMLRQSMLRGCRGEPLPPGFND